MEARDSHIRPARRRATIVSVVFALLSLAGPGVGSTAASVPGVSWSATAPVWPINQAACSSSIATTHTTTRTYLHAVTQTGTNSDTYVGREVVYRRSANLGQTWPAVVQLTANHEYESCARIAASGSTVVVVWEATPVEGHPSIKLRVSTNHGITWGPIHRIPAPRDAGGPSVAVTGSTIFVAWTDSAPAPAWSRIAKSRDLGATWTLRRLDAKPALGETLVAASGGTVVTAWLRSPNRELVTRLSLDSGISWRYPSVTRPADPSNEIHISLAARGGRVAVALSDIRDPAIVVRVGTDGVWAPPVEVSAVSPNATSPYGFMHAPAVTLLSNSRVGLAFAACYAYEVDGSCGQGTAGTVDDALWAESPNNGNTWTTPVVISFSATDASGWSNINDISVAWPSSNLRAVLVWRMSGETEWLSRNFFTRGYGLP